MRFFKTNTTQLKHRTVSLFLAVLFVLPTSSNYKMQSYSLGTGGAGTTESENYGLHATVGELGSNPVGGTYNLGAGLAFVRQAPVPAAPTLENPDNSFNSLKFTLNPGSEPSDTRYLLAVSTDNWVTTYYVQAADNTLGLTKALSDYQTYADWGGASGSTLVGLDANQTYEMKVRALHGSYTESGYSQTASASTVSSVLSFDIDVSSIDEKTAPPYLIDLGSLTTGSVVTSSDKIWVDLETNGAAGGFVYVYSANNGLRSASTNYTITSLSGNLSIEAEGMGLQSDSTSQDSGGPLRAVSPFDGVGETVGGIPTTSSILLDSSAAPVYGGRASLVLKAKASSTTPTAPDYQETITLIASATF